MRPMSSKLVTTATVPYSNGTKTTYPTSVSGLSSIVTANSTANRQSFFYGDLTPSTDTGATWLVPTDTNTVDDENPADIQTGSVNVDDLTLALRMFVDDDVYSGKTSVNSGSSEPELFVSRMQQLLVFADTSDKINVYSKTKTLNGMDLLSPPVDFKLAKMRHLLKIVNLALNHSSVVEYVGVVECSQSNDVLNIKTSGNPDVRIYFVDKTGELLKSFTVFSTNFVTYAAVNNLIMLPFSNIPGFVPGTHDVRAVAVDGPDDDISPIGIHCELSTYEVVFANMDLMPSELETDFSATDEYVFKVRDNTADTIKLQSVRVFDRSGNPVSEAETSIIYPRQQSIRSSVDDEPIPAMVVDKLANAIAAQAAFAADESISEVVTVAQDELESANVAHAITFADNTNPQYLVNAQSILSAALAARAYNNTYDPVLPEDVIDSKAALDKANVLRAKALAEYETPAYVDEALNVYHTAISDKAVIVADDTTPSHVINSKADVDDAETVLATAKADDTVPVYVTDAEDVLAAAITEQAFVLNDTTLAPKVEDALSVLDDAKVLWEAAKADNTIPQYVIDSADALTAAEESYDTIYEDTSIPLFLTEAGETLKAAKITQAAAVAAVSDTVQPQYVIDTANILADAVAQRLIVIADKTVPQYLTDTKSILADAIAEKARALADITTTAAETVAVTGAVAAATAAHALSVAKVTVDKTAAIGVETGIVATAQTAHNLNVAAEIVVRNAVVTKANLAVATAGSQLALRVTDATVLKATKVGAAFAVKTKATTFHALRQGQVVADHNKSVAAANGVVLAAATAHGTSITVATTARAAKIASVNLAFAAATTALTNSKAKAVAEKGTVVTKAAGVVAGKAAYYQLRLAAAIVEKAARVTAAAVVITAALGAYNGRVTAAALHKAKVVSDENAKVLKTQTVYNLRHAAYVLAKARTAAGINLDVANAVASNTANRTAAAVDKAAAVAVAALRVTHATTNLALRTTASVTERNAARTAIDVSVASATASLTMDNISNDVSWTGTDFITSKNKFLGVDLFKITLPRYKSVASILVTPGTSGTVPTFDIIKNGVMINSTLDDTSYSIPQHIPVITSADDTIFVEPYAPGISVLISDQNAENFFMNAAISDYFTGSSEKKPIDPDSHIFSMMYDLVNDPGTAPTSYRQTALQNGDTIYGLGEASNICGPFENNLPYSYYIHLQDVGGTGASFGTGAQPTIYSFKNAKIVTHVKIKRISHAYNKGNSLTKLSIMYFHIPSGVYKETNILNQSYATTDGVDNFIFDSPLYTNSILFTIACPTYEEHKQFFGLGERLAIYGKEPINGYLVNDDTTNFISINDIVNEVDVPVIENGSYRFVANTSRQDGFIVSNYSQMIATQPAKTVTSTVTSVRISFDGFNTLSIIPYGHKLSLGWRYGLLSKPLGMAYRYNAVYERYNADPFDITITEPGTYSVIAIGGDFSQISTSKIANEIVYTPMSQPDALPDPLLSTISSVAIRFDGFNLLTVSPSGTNKIDGWGCVIEHTSTITGTITNIFDGISTKEKETISLTQPGMYRVKAQGTDNGEVKMATLANEIINAPTPAPTPDNVPIALSTVWSVKATFNGFNLLNVTPNGINISDGWGYSIERSIEGIWLNVSSGISYNSDETVVLAHSGLYRARAQGTDNGSVKVWTLPAEIGYTPMDNMDNVNTLSFDGEFLFTISEVISAPTLFGPGIGTTGVQMTPNGNVKTQLVYAHPNMQSGEYYVTSSDTFMSNLHVDIGQSLMINLNMVIVTAESTDKKIELYQNMINIGELQIPVDGMSITKIQIGTPGSYYAVRTLYDDKKLTTNSDEAQSSHSPVTDPPQPQFAFDGFDLINVLNIPEFATRIELFRDDVKLTNMSLVTKSIQIQTPGSYQAFVYNSSYLIVETRIIVVTIVSASSDSTVLTFNNDNTLDVLNLPLHSTKIELFRNGAYIADISTDNPTTRIGILGTCYAFIYEIDGAGSHLIVETNKIDVIEVSTSALPFDGHSTLNITDISSNAVTQLFRDNVLISQYTAIQAAAMHIFVPGRYHARVMSVEETIMIFETHFIDIPTLTFVPSTVEENTINPAGDNGTYDVNFVFNDMTVTSVSLVRTVALFTAINLGGRMKLTATDITPGSYIIRFTEGAIEYDYAFWLTNTHINDTYQYYIDGNN